MEPTPSCEQCVQLERDLALLERQMAEQDVRLQALAQALRDRDTRIAALEQRVLALSRRLR